MSSSKIPIHGIRISTSERPGSGVTIWPGVTGCVWKKASGYLDACAEWPDGGGMRLHIALIFMDGIEWPEQLILEPLDPWEEGYDLKKFLLTRMQRSTLMRLMANYQL